MVLPSSYLPLNTILSRTLDHLEILVKDPGCWLWVQAPPPAGLAGKAKPSCSLSTINKDTAYLKSSVFLVALNKFMQFLVVKIMRLSPNVRFPLQDKVHLRAADVILSY